jgi:hypothetical protein
MYRLQDLLQYICVEFKTCYMYILSITDIGPSKAFIPHMLHKYRVEMVAFYTDIVLHCTVFHMYFVLQGLYIYSM